MAVLSASPRSLRAAVGRHGSSLSCGLIVLAVLLGAVPDRNLPLAVYLLSFWHYYLYWLAFTFGAIPFAAFKRDAVAMKTVSVAALAIVYLATPIDPLSLFVIAAGSLLNIRAAAALGVDRTYYGYEVAGLPPRRITAFPYSLTSHPMILGNVAAFGGTLINPGFREQWWPLACLHVALNIGLLAMEQAGKARGRLVRIGGALVLAGALAAAALAGLAMRPGVTAPAPMMGTVVMGLAALAGAWALHRCYAPPGARKPPTGTTRETP